MECWKDGVLGGDAAPHTPVLHHSITPTLPGVPMADYKEILYEKQRGGVLITLNRPEALNAITRPMLKEIHHALDQAEADPEIRAIVITGAGRAFSSGFDQATTSGRRRDLQMPKDIHLRWCGPWMKKSWGIGELKLIRIFE